MVRRLIFPLAVVVACACAQTDNHASGDKFLRVGRSARFRQYASVHPSAILVFAPQWTDRGINDFEAMLKRAGHTALTVTSRPALAQALASEKYQVVITGYRQAALTRVALQEARSTAALLPVIYQVTKAEAEEARTAYACLITPEKMTNYDALEEIDRLIDSQPKKVVSGPSR